MAKLPAGTGKLISCASSGVAATTAPFATSFLHHGSRTFSPTQTRYSTIWVASAEVVTSRYKASLFSQPPPLSESSKTRTSQGSNGLQRVPPKNAVAPPGGGPPAGRRHQDDSLSGRFNESVTSSWVSETCVSLPLEFWKQPPRRSRLRRRTLSVPKKTVSLSAPNASRHGRSAWSHWTRGGILSRPSFLLTDR